MCFISYDQVQKPSYAINKFINKYKTPLFTRVYTHKPTSPWNIADVLIEWSLIEMLNNISDNIE